MLLLKIMSTRYRCNCLDVLINIWALLSTIIFLSIILLVGIFSIGLRIFPDWYKSHTFYVAMFLSCYVVRFSQTDTPERLCHLEMLFPGGSWYAISLISSVFTYVRSS